MEAAMISFKRGIFPFKRDREQEGIGLRPEAEQGQADRRRERYRGASSAVPAVEMGRRGKERRGTCVVERRR